MFNKLKRRLIGISKPVIYPEFNDPIYYILDIRNKYIRLFAGLFPGIFRNLYKEEVGCRIVENPFVFLNLNLKKGAKILDFGCTTNRMSVQLANLGFKVTGVDFREYPYTHPNLNFIKGDFLKNRFKDSYFDAIIAISAVEHAGIGRYGEKRYERGDIKIMNEFRRILKKGGRLLITVPYGEAGVTPQHRVYDYKGLKELLKGFKIVKEEFYLRKGRTHWLEVSKDSDDIKKRKDGKTSVALVFCIKK